MNRSLLTVLALLPALAVASRSQDPAPLDEAAAKAEAARAAAVRHQLPSYPLTVCLISGDALDADDAAPVDHLHEGRLVRFCCKGCVKEFAKNPAPVLAAVDQAVVRAQLPGYPLTTCVVSGEALGGEHGPPVEHVHGTRLVRFCCSTCVSAFQAAPDAFLADLDAALIRAQLARYPLATCLVSEEPLGGEMGPPIEHLYGTRLVRFCCKGCVKAFQKAPARWLARLDEAAAAKKAQEQSAGSKG